MNFDINLLLIPLFLLSGVIWLFYVLKDIIIKNRDKSNKSTPWWLDYSRSLFPIIAIVVVIRSFIAEPYQIPSGSMIPTLQQGDFILVNKYHYGLRLPINNYEVVSLNKPQRGDIMVFNFPLDTRVRYIKRVIGLPGDIISYSNKTLWINKKRVLSEVINSDNDYKEELEYLRNSAANRDGDNKQAQHTIRKYDFVNDESIETWQVPTQHYFVMGDNRDNSNDSRYWGFVPHNHLVGKAFFIWLHWKSWQQLPSFKRLGPVI